MRSGAILAPSEGFIRIGNECGFNHNTIIYDLGGLTIRNLFRSAANCLVIPANHNFVRSEAPIYKQPLTKIGIVIGSDIWVGAHSVILDGMRTGMGRSSEQAPWLVEISNHMLSRGVTRHDCMTTLSLARCSRYSGE